MESLNSGPENSDMVQPYPNTETDFTIVSIIIPVRENGSINVVDRLRWRQHYDRSNIEILLIDDGSSEQYSEQIRNLSQEMGIRYLYLETKDAPFSLSRARNAGIYAAKSQFVYFEDIDFIGKVNFYQDLIKLAGHLKDSPLNFFSIPTLFLTSQMSARLLASDDFDNYFDTLVAQLPFINPENPNDIIDSYALVGSNILLKRSLCFHVGLFDEYFNSWGGEDREFVFRLLNHNSRVLIPENFSATKKWKVHRTNIFEGWRALYRLHGDYVKNLGVYSVHIYHPENSWKDPFARKANFKYCDDKISATYSRHIKTYPVKIDTEKHSTVFIGRNPTFYNDDVMDILESVSVVDVEYDTEPHDFIEKVINENPKQVMFQNVYSNEWMKSVWNLLQDCGIKCICVERGAFPKSIYFDANGFCAESSSYDESAWKNSIPVDAKRYIESLRLNSAALEPQGTDSIENLKNKLNKEKKIVLVILQSLTDATTKYFTNPLSSYDEFLNVIRSLIDNNRYNVIVKNHPLNRVMPIKSGIDVSNYDLYDLINISDVCVTLNSGAGLHALGYGCPVIAMGQCFYAKRGLAHSASSLESVTAYIESNPIVDETRVNQFYGYLLNQFYSFADWKYGVRRKSDNTNMSLMHDVKYKRIRIGEINHKVTRSILSRYSLLMDPFSYDMFIKRNTSGRSSKISVTEKYRNRVGIDNRTSKNRRKAKFEKFKNDPYAFFQDTRYPVTQILKFLFKKK